MFRFEAGPTIRGVNGASCGQADGSGISGECLAQLRRITKSFSGVRALNGVSLEVRAGEVHAVTGENGAGKSTLMKVLAGLHAPDSGEVIICGRGVRLGSPHAARQAGVAMIHQELLPFPELTVAENIFMGQEPVSGPLRWIDKTAMRRNATDLLGRLGVELSTVRKMRELRVAEMQAVEIAKALAHRARVIIMDEPTSALSEREAEALFRMIGDLRQHGAAVTYISHKLEEIFRLADRVTVLRDGSHVATKPLQELTAEQLIALMVGRQLQAVSAPARAGQGEVALSVKNLNKAGRFRNINFEVRQGEILGLAGLMGAGRTDVVNAIYGLEAADSGDIRVRGEVVRVRKPGQALAAGIGLVSEDRRVFGLVPTLDVKRNLTLAALRRWCRGGLIRQAAENRAANEQIRAFAIRTSGPNQPINHLSGGNPQKVVLARTLLTDPTVLLLDEPTRGIDIAAKAEVHALVARLAAAGKAIVLVSSELPELFALSNRILVMRQGELAAELETERTSPEEVLRFAMPR